MMPDRYDELKKRKLLEEAMPSQEEPVDYSEGDTIEQKLLNSPQEKQLTGSDERIYNTKELDRNKAYGDLAVAATPYLMSLFNSSGSAPEIANRYASANKYLQNRALADQVHKKELVSISNEEGSPEYVRAEDALGMEPYYQPKGSVASSLVKGVPHKMFNPITGERAIISVGNDNIARRIGSPDPMDISHWIQDLGVGSATGTDISGTKTQEQYEKGAPELPKKQIKSTTGLGAHMGVGTKIEAETRIKEAQKGMEKSAESEKNLANLDIAEQTVKRTKDPMVFAIVVGKALRTIEKRLSDKEQDTFMGGKYKSFALQAREIGSGKFKGEIPESIRQNALNAIRLLKEQGGAELEATKKSYSEKAGLSKAGQKIIENVSGGPGEPKPVDNRDWKTKLLEIK